MSLYTRLQGNLRTLGWVDSFWLAMHFLLSRTFRGAAVNSYFIMARRTAHETQLRPDQATSITVRAVPPGDPALAQIPRPPDVIRMRFAQGGVCYGAFNQDAFAGFLWMQSRTYCEDEFRCCFKLPGNDIAMWSYDVFVMPAHRLGLTFLKLREDVDAVLRGKGVAWTVGRISAFNLRSRTSHERLGYRSLGRCVVINVGRLQVVLSVFRPYLHVSLSAGRFPTITLRFPD